RALDPARHRAAPQHLRAPADREGVGHAAALPDHHRRGAAAPPPPARRSQRHPRGCLKPLALSPADWLEVFLRISTNVRAAVAPLSGTEAGREPLEMGAGGDRTMELDRVAESIVLDELQALADRGERFSALSEEVGLRRCWSMRTRFVSSVRWRFRWRTLRRVVSTSSARRCRCASST